MTPKSTISNTFVAAIAAISLFFVPAQCLKKKTYPLEGKPGTAFCINNSVM